MTKGTIPTECPRCDALQLFEPKRRMINKQKDIIEIYIRCAVCRYHKILRVSTVEIENLRRMRIEKVSAINALRNRGLEPVVLMGQLKAITKTVSEKEQELREELAK